MSRIKLAIKPKTPPREPYPDIEEIWKEIKHVLEDGPERFKAYWSAFVGDSGIVYSEDFNELIDYRQKSLSYINFLKNNKLSAGQYIPIIDSLSMYVLETTDKIVKRQLQRLDPSDLGQVAYDIELRKAERTLRRMALALTGK